MVKFENLYRSYRLASRAKHDKKEIVKFETNLSQSIWKLIEELDKGTYKPSNYRKFNIYEPKEREIQALPFSDRVVQHCLCDNILRGYFENYLIYDNAACRVGKGTHFAMDRLTYFLREYYRKYGSQGYILKYDIYHFFHSIDHEVLKEKLSNFPDQRVRKMLYDIVDSYDRREDGCIGKGIPMGNQTSQWFALYYLDPMDRLIKEKWRVKYYVRYMDDGVLVHESKEYLQEVLKSMKALAKELKLEFNSKTQIFPLKQGVDFLGFRFYLTDTGKVVKRLRTSNKKRWKRRLKKFQREYKEGNKNLEEILKSLNSYSGHLSHGHTYKLRKHVYSNFLLRK